MNDDYEDDDDDDLIRRARTLPREAPSPQLRDSVRRRARAETRRAARTRGLLAVTLAVASATLGSWEDRRIVRLVAGDPRGVAPASVGLELVAELGLGGRVSAMHARARALAQWNLARQPGRLERPL